ncbi:MAG: hypothetical protein GX781_08700 [Clostridiales bacterium]|nr:hypothetical protein [Clostridiales bacterium]
MKPLRLGIISIGSNSVKMMTANIDETLSDPQRAREETALFLSMNDKRSFSEEGMERCARAVSKLHHMAKQAGAQEVRLIATSAMRDALNRNELDFYIAAMAPMTLSRIISGDEEAQLSFLGAACASHQEGLQGMIDIGGGSTELAIGDRATGLSFTKSLQLGTSRLLQWQPINNREDMRSALNISSELIGKELTLPAQLPKEWTLVGGTGTTLINMMLMQPYHQPCPEGKDISRDEAGEWLERLALLSPQERAALPGMPSSRVHILPTGLTILKSLMDYLNINRIRVTRRNNLDGYLYRLYHCPQEDHDA